MRVYCVGVLSISMGPGRYSSRVAARNLVKSLASTAASGLSTPQGVSNISKAKLKHLKFPQEKTRTEGDNISHTSEDKPATEEFNLGEPALKLDSIKRKLTFCPKTLTMSDFDWDRGIGSKPRARKGETIVKLEPDDDGPVKERSRRISKPKVLKVKVENAKEGNEFYEATVNGKVRQEPQVKALTRPCHQHADIYDIVKREFREEDEPRRMKLQSNFAKVTKVNEKGWEKNVYDPAKQASARVISQRKRKLPEQDSSSATRKIQAYDLKQGSKAVEGTALGLEVVSVRSGNGAQLASGETFSTTIRRRLPSPSVQSQSASGITLLGGPYPNFARPFPEECQQAKDLLSALHGHLPEYERHKVSCPTIEKHVHVQPMQNLDPSSSDTEARSLRHVLESEPEVIDNVQMGSTQIAPSGQGCRPKGTVPGGHRRDRRAILDSLIGTLLSQNTTDNNSRRAFASLKSAFPTWEEVLSADATKVEDAIRCGGLAEIKAHRIRTILSTLLRERGEVSMEYLRSMSNENIKAELSRFNGVGPKTVACVLMFHLQRKEFPVDTHVFHISKMLGWVPEQADREKAYLHLNQRIPDPLKFDIHCLFVTHGKRCPKCAKRFNRQPSDGECPLIDWKSKWFSKRNAPTIKPGIAPRSIGKLNGTPRQNLCEGRLW